MGKEVEEVVGGGEVAERGTARMGRGKYLLTDNHAIQSSVQIVGGDLMNLSY